MHHNNRVWFPDSGSDLIKSATQYIKWTPCSDCSKSCNSSEIPSPAVPGIFWDLRQTYRTIAPYTLEEAYEVADAIERGDMRELRNELGDLLFALVNVLRLSGLDAEQTSNGVSERWRTTFGISTSPNSAACPWNSSMQPESGSNPMNQTVEVKPGLFAAPDQATSPIHGDRLPIYQPGSHTVNTP